MTAQAAGPDWAVDAAGGKDHPLLQRYANSWLIEYSQADHDLTSFPTRPDLNDLQYVDPVEVEGRVSRFIYLAPVGRSPAEVFRNYQQALAGAGFKPQVSCTPKDKVCDDIRTPLRDRESAMERADFAATKGRLPKDSPARDDLSGLGGPNMLGTEDIYFTSGTLSRNGQTAYVMVHTGKVYSTHFTATYIEIAEPKAMQGGQVTVNADALGQGLKDEGKIALYGIYFDTGKAEIKPESKAQLDEIGKLLKAQPKLAVHLVGHTDNQGALDANLALSQRRAEAVMQALAKTYGVSAGRMDAHGVASLAPVAANDSDPGRARNRRVELVVR